VKSRNGTVLIDVDTQFDFCDPKGALHVRGAERLGDAFRALVGRAVEAGVPILASADSHAFDAWEFEGAPEPGPNGERPGFPPHCVKGTAGWLKVPGTLAPRARFVPNTQLAGVELARLATAHDPQQLVLEKEVYSLFANPNADRLLHVVAPEGARFVVFGVALDYCVKAATLGLVDWLARGRRGEVLLVQDATVPVDAGSVAAVLDTCREKGARLIDTRDALAVIAST
jgi:nicotinamidase/pyrazinamidase